MNYKPSILNVAAVLFLVGIVIYSIYKYPQLSEGEGWGVVAMIGLFGVGLVLIILDFILQWFFKNRTAINIIGAALLLITGVLLLAI